ncbi:unnamed protein product [Pleuronectes platessa]|uniref:Uncharacterized protein n=1 Tax=Pleuronectes platessa TaxID=8262 RepID=A0A9N7VGS4_PLEPL|nr:unnamed protein product [Pleuronectes platessa]
MPTYKIVDLRFDSTAAGERTTGSATSRNGNVAEDELAATRVWRRLTGPSIILQPGKDPRQAAKVMKT